ncbi:hypothetical protein [Trueperella sp. HMSC08H06]|uniref:hypothetical protein n=1 Tax=Trueperella sp. HMSC08H06 TaxID=1581142 RepID=UPI0008A5481E|nr:hypothetical protein [Trueperella sp. HMSC08H06]OFS67535.1 hypothetical protein HMPREF3174_03665 [Trueperella sp. HMSC08H06]
MLYAFIFLFTLGALAWAPGLGVAIIIWGLFYALTTMALDATRARNAELDALRAASCATRRGGVRHG